MVYVQKLYMPILIPSTNYVCFHRDHKATEKSSNFYLRICLLYHDNKIKLVVSHTGIYCCGRLSPVWGICIWLSFLPRGMLQLGKYEIFTEKRTKHTNWYVYTLTIQNKDEHRRGHSKIPSSNIYEQPYRSSITSFNLRKIFLYNRQDLLKSATANCVEWLVSDSVSSD